MNFLVFGFALLLLALIIVAIFWLKLTRKPFDPEEYSREILSLMEDRIKNKKEVHQ